MKTSMMKAAILALTTTFAVTANAGGEQILTMDTPMTGDKTVSKPTFVDDTTSTRKMAYLSVNYAYENCDWSDLSKCPEPFDIIFEAAFKDQYEVDADKYTAGVEQANGEIKFTATKVKPNGDDCDYNPPGNGSEDYKCYIVKLKLKNSAAKGTSGYQYRVEMGGGVIDPRLRGK